MNAYYDLLKESSMSGTTWQAIASPADPPAAPFNGVPVLVSDGTNIDIAQWVAGHVVVNATFTMQQVDGSWTVVPAAPETFPDAWRVMEGGKFVTDASGNYVTVTPTHWQPAPAP